MHDSISAEPNNQRNPYGADKIDQRKKYCVIKDRLYICFAMVVVNTCKAAQRFPLSIEELHRLRSRKVFLQECIDPSYSSADHIKASSRSFSKPGRRGP